MTERRARPRPRPRPPAIMQPAWERQPEAQPGFVYDTPAQALANPATVPFQRRRSVQEIEQQRQLQQLAANNSLGGVTGIANGQQQAEEFGRGALEMTGAPAWARGIQDLQYGRPGEAIPEFLWGAINTAGVATLPFGAGGRPPPRMGMAPSVPRAIANDPNIIPRRMPEQMQPPRPGYVSTANYPERLWTRPNEVGVGRVNSASHHMNFNLSPEEQAYLDSLSPAERAQFLIEHGGEDLLTAYERTLVRQTDPTGRARERWNLDPEDPVLRGSPDIAADPLAAPVRPGFGQRLPQRTAPNEDRYLFGRLPPQARQRPMPSMNPPARLPGRASDGSVLPVRPSEPFRNSMRGGSADLRDAAAGRVDMAPEGGVPGGSADDVLRDANAVAPTRPPLTPAETRLLRTMEGGIEEMNAARADIADVLNRSYIDRDVLEEVLRTGRFVHRGEVLDPVPRPSPAGLIERQAPMIEGEFASIARSSPDAGGGQGRNTLGPRARQRFEVGGRSYRVEIEPDVAADAAVVNFRSIEQGAGGDGINAYAPTGDAGTSAPAVFSEVRAALRRDIAEHGRRRYGLIGDSQRQTELYQRMARTTPAPEGYTWSGPDSAGMVFLERRALPDGGSAQPNAGPTRPKPMFPGREKR